MDTPKKLPEGTQKQKPVTNDIHKLKTRANETEYWKKYNDNNNTTIMRAVYSLAHYYHWKTAQSLPHLLDNVNKTWGQFLVLPYWQFVCLITLERPLPLYFAMNRKWSLLNTSKETAICSVLFVTIYWSKKNLPVLN